jgi:predicted ABC-type exoprotein transport system permease subunit
MKKQPKNWLIYSGLAIQIGLVMFLMVELGHWIRHYWQLNSKIPLLICSLLGICIVLVLIQKKSKKP